MNLLQISLLSSSVFLTACSKDSDTSREDESPAHKICEENANFTFEKGNDSQKKYVKDRITKVCEEAFTPCSTEELNLLKDVADFRVLKDKLSQACFEGIQKFSNNMQAELQGAIKDAAKFGPTPLTTEPQQINFPRINVGDRPITLPLKVSNPNDKPAENVVFAIPQYEKFTILDKDTCKNIPAKGDCTIHVETAFSSWENFTFMQSESHIPISYTIDGQKEKLEVRVVVSATNENRFRP